MPGETIVEKNGEGDEAYDNTYLQISWPVKKETSQPISGNEDESTLATEISFYAHTWKFDGHFSKATEEKGIGQSLVSDDTYLIRSMAAYPTRYAGERTKERLLRRGQMFWDCRFRRYVSYCGWDYNHSEYTVSSMNCWVLVRTNRFRSVEERPVHD